MDNAAHMAPTKWVFSVIGKNRDFSGITIGEVTAIDPRDALSRALASDDGTGKLIGNVFKVPPTVILDAPANFDSSLDIDLDHLAIKLRRVSLASFDPPADWRPYYSKWRHGGWYTNASYASGTSGCVSSNYADGKWRIVCDRRHASFDISCTGGITYRSRDAAARAEYALTQLEEAGLYPKDYH